MADSNEKETTLTEEHVIIIACVCGVIIVSLLIILFCFIFRRKRNAAKAYQGSNQGEPPPYNAVSANKKPQVYDNQGMDTSDLQLTETVDGMHSPAPWSPSPFCMHANSNSFTNNSYGPLDLYTGYKSQQPETTPSPKEDPVWSTGLHADMGTANKAGVESQLYLQHKYNNGTEGYPTRDAPDISSVPHSPSKDRYIGLQDRAGGGDPMIGTLEGNYLSGDISAGASKPKKVIYEVVV